MDATPGDEVTIYPDEDGDPTVVVARSELLDDPVGVMMRYLQPTDDEKARTRNTLAARMRDAGRDTFAAVCWTFLVDAAGATAKRKESERKVDQYCADHETDRETLLGANAKLRAKWEKVVGTSEDFDPNGNAARTLFGRLKAYKPKPDNGKGPKE